MNDYETETFRLSDGAGLDVVNSCKIFLVIPINALKKYNIFHFLQEEYEAARAELIQEVNRGTTIEKLRERLTKKSPQAGKQSNLEQKIPDDLVQVQAYIRWEKAGKPNFSQDQQLV